MLRRTGLESLSVALRYRQPLGSGEQGIGGGRTRPAAGKLDWGKQPKKVAPATAPRDARLARVEAVLLLASEPLGIRKIGQFASLADATEARTLIRRLNQIYDQQGTAFRVEEVAGGFQLLTRSKFGGWLRRLQQASVETRLSNPALETLAIVAYRQPVLRAEIEAVRGVQCGEMLRQLMERDLIRIAGRSEELGRPFQYATTKRFLQVFGLRHLDELPRAEDLRRRPSETAVGAGPHGPTPGESRPETTSLLLSTEESHVSITANPELAPHGELEEEQRLLLASARAAAEDEEEELDDDADDDDEEDDDEEEEEDDDFDDDFDDDDWEEVDDDDDEEDDDEEDDDDWEEDEDEDWEEEEDDEWEDDEDEEEEEEEEDDAE
jgi:segregation and condensation protein B